MSEQKQKVKVTKLTNERFLNLYLVEYPELGVKWTVASRRSEENLEVIANSPTADAINILPYGYDENGKVVVFLIKEFRYPTNCEIYSVPAGLVEKDKDEEETVRSEIFEEIGGKVLSVRKIDSGAYTTPGLTDEKMSFFEAEVELSGTQHLEGTERIKLIPTPLSQVEKMLNDGKHVFDVKGICSLRQFIERQKNRELLTKNESLENENARLKAELKSLRAGKNVSDGKPPLG